MKRLKDIKLEVYSFMVDLDLTPFPDFNNSEGKPLRIHDIQLEGYNNKFLLPEQIYEELKVLLWDSPLAELFDLKVLRRHGFAIITVYILP